MAQSKIYLNTYISETININTILFILPSMHTELTRLTGSKSKADEILFVLNDIKNVVRQAFYQNEIQNIKSFCTKHSLHLTTSRFKVLYQEQVGEFSNLGLRVPLTDPRNGMIHVYISKDEASAHLAHYFELMQNDASLGGLLGYPTCCVAYFTSTFSKENPNPVQDNMHPLLNLSKRSSDVVLISHFPCKNNCEESKKIAKRNLSFIEKYYPGRAYEIKQTLRL